MAHPSWTFLFVAFGVVVGLLDGVSPQSWNMPGQRGDVWMRTLNGALAPMAALIALGTIVLTLDSFTSLGRMHALLATLSGIVLIGIAATSVFALLSEYAVGEQPRRPVNIFASSVVGRFRFPGDFVPSPAGFGAFLLAFNAPEMSDAIAVFVSFFASFLLGATFVAVMERRSATGLVQQPIDAVRFLFEYAPMFTNAVLLIAASLLIHAGLEFDSFFRH